METEGEKEKEKKGWFSKKKKNNGNVNGGEARHVSRPPSASPFSHSQGTGTRTSTPTPNSDDDDLPPRLTSAPSSPTKSAVVAGSSDATPDLDADTSTTTTPVHLPLPLHAGFDFDAIKAVLGDAKASLNPDELGIRGNDNNTYQPLLTNRSESAPHLEGPRRSWSSADAGMGDVDHPIPGPSSLSLSLSHLPSSFSRTLSLNDVHDGYPRERGDDDESEYDDDDDKRGQGQGSSSTSPPLSSFDAPPPLSSYDDESPFDKTPRMSHAPLSLSFASEDDNNDMLSWKASPSSSSSYHNHQTIAPSSGGYSYSQSHHHQPTPNHNFPFASETGMSFGAGGDGISSDPWKISTTTTATEFGKKSLTGGNPWS